ncbi:MAG: hypothetical protein AABX11_04175 [Nanoarchaeota archaeon]
MTIRNIPKNGAWHRFNFYPSFYNAKLDNPTSVSYTLSKFREEGLAVKLGESLPFGLPRDIFVKSPDSRNYFDVVSKVLNNKNIKPRVRFPYLIVP